MAIRREENNACFRARYREFDPSLGGRELLVGKHSETQLLRVEAERALLIANGDSDEFDALDHAGSEWQRAAQESIASYGLAAFHAIALIAVAMKIDPYVVDTLMRDLVAHSRSPAAFLVYLQLYRLTHGAGRESVAMSHSVMAELVGISKRSVQLAVAHLAERRLIKKQRSRPTSVPVYTVLTPWVRVERNR
jgi:hypothetical protein